MPKDLFSETTALEFISDSELNNLISTLIRKINLAVKQKDKSVFKNVVDPFSALFDSFYQDITLEKWLDQEKNRQLQKTLQNLIGDFHQSVIGSIPGWDNLKSGKSIDLRNMKKKIIAEIKNKHNTMNSSSALAVYDKLQKHIDYGDAYEEFTAYCVAIIPIRPGKLDALFAPSERGTPRPRRENIRIIDGKSFYEIATGDPDSLQKLYTRIAFLLAKEKGSDFKKYISNKPFREFFELAYIKK